MKEYPFETFICEHCGEQFRQAKKGRRTWYCRPSCAKEGKKKRDAQLILDVLGPQKETVK
jgi:hypothetical protein